MIFHLLISSNLEILAEQTEGNGCDIGKTNN